MVQSPYNVMKMDSASVSQGSLASLAMNALLESKETNVMNAHQNFMDTQIAKVCLLIFVMGFILNVIVFLECDCNPDGSTTLECNVLNGDCTCKEGFGGSKCDDLLIGSKVLLAQGSGEGKNTEVLDLEDPSFRCTVSQFPTGAWGGAGGLVGNTPLVCGGFENKVVQKACYSLNEDGTWKNEADLNTARRFVAAGYVIMDNGLVIAGGEDTNIKNLASIEIVAPNTSSKTLSISLPEAAHASCIVPWDTNTFMVIGGWSNRYMADTGFVNMANGTYTKGPNLIVGRYSAACSTININGEDYIIVNGGQGYNSKQTELLKKSDFKSGWIKSNN